MTGNLINNYASFTSFARNQSLQTVILQRRGNTMDAVVAPCVSPLTGKGRFSVAKRFRCGAAVPPGARSTRSKRGGTSSCLNPAVAGRLRPPPPGHRDRLQTSPCVHQGRRSRPPDDDAAVVVAPLVEKLSANRSATAAQQQNGRLGVQRAA